MHETTHLYLQTLKKLLKTNKHLLNINYKNNILSIATTKINTNHIVTIDINPPTIETTIENTSINHINSRIDTSNQLLQHIDNTFDIILTNILNNILINLKQQLYKQLQPNNHLLLNKILTKKTNYVTNTFTSLNLKLINNFSKNK